MFGRLGDRGRNAFACYSPDPGELVEAVAALVEIVALKLLGRRLALGRVVDGKEAVDVPGDDLRAQGGRLSGGPKEQDEGGQGGNFEVQGKTEERRVGKEGVRKCKSRGWPLT